MRSSSTGSAATVHGSLHVEAEAQPVRRALLGEAGDGRGHQLFELHRLHHRLHGAGVDLREVHQVAEHAVDRFAGAHDLLRHRVAPRRVGRLAEDVGEEQQRLHRLAHVVAGRAEEARAGPLRLLLALQGARAAASTSTAFCCAASTASRNCAWTMRASRTSMRAAQAHADADQQHVAQAGALDPAEIHGQQADGEVERVHPRLHGQHRDGHADPADRHDGEHAQVGHLQRRRKQRHRKRQQPVGGSRDIGDVAQRGLGGAIAFDQVAEVGLARQHGHRKRDIPGKEMPPADRRNEDRPQGAAHQKRGSSARPGLGKDHRHAALD